MICQECNQRPATLHFTKIINGQKNEFHICEQCAREKGEQIPGSNSFSIHQLLSGLLNVEQPISTEDEQQRVAQALTCDNCGMTFEQFKRIGRFGCSHCYTNFSSKLDPILKRVHSGNHAHTGKIPARIGGDIQLQRQIDQFKEKLKQYVEQEEFEKAAELRDRVRELEKQKSSQGEG